MSYKCCCCGLDGCIQCKAQNPCPGTSDSNLEGPNFVVPLNDLSNYQESPISPPVKGVLGTIGAGAKTYEVSLVGETDDTGQVKYFIELAHSGGGDTQYFQVPAGVHKVFVEDGAIRGLNHPYAYIYRMRNPTDGAQRILFDVTKTNIGTGEVQNSSSIQSPKQQPGSSSSKISTE
jgi:hypothetical protein